MTADSQTRPDHSGFTNEAAKMQNLIPGLANSVTHVYSWHHLGIIERADPGEEDDRGDHKSFEQ